MDATDALLLESRQKNMAAVVDAIPMAPERSALKLNVIGISDRNGWTTDKMMNWFLLPALQC